MAVAKSKGLVPVATLGGGTNRTRYFRNGLDNAQAQNIAIGDALTLDIAGGDAGRFDLAVAAGVIDAIFHGVEFVAAATGKNTLGSSWVSGTQATGPIGVWVFNDPDTVFETYVDGLITDRSIGLNADITYAAPVRGVSKTFIASADIDATARSLKIVDVFEQADGATRVYVTLNKAQNVR